MKQQRVEIYTLTRNRYFKFFHRHIFKPQGIIFHKFWSVIHLFTCTFRTFVYDCSSLMHTWTTQLKTFGLKQYLYQRIYLGSKDVHANAIYRSQDLSNIHLKNKMKLMQQWFLMTFTVVFCVIMTHSLLPVQVD